MYKENENPIRDILEDSYENLIFIDGFDSAIIGVSDNFTEPKVVYSRKKCIAILCSEMDYMDAIEHFDFNIAGAYVGEQTPVICNDDWDEF